ncbi:hypothetical protein ACP70R_041673 [Stipagrostis hirtigluma subsp. patula]
MNEDANVPSHGLCLSFSCPRRGQRPLNGGKHEAGHGLFRKHMRTISGFVAPYKLLPSIAFAASDFVLESPFFQFRVVFPFVLFLAPAVSVLAIAKF